MKRLGRIAATMLVAMLAGSVLAPAGADAQEAEAPPAQAPPSSSRENGGAIIGGEGIPIADAPHQVGIVVDYDLPNEPPGSRYFVCGGSILSNRVIVTAAHCLFNDFEGGRAVRPDEVFVLAGTNRLDAPIPLVSVSSIGRHPRYDAWQLTDDLAFLRLTNTLPLLADTREAITPATPDDLASYAAGIDATITGWGVSDYEQDISLAELQGATLPIVGDAACLDVYDDDYGPDAVVGATQVCAGGGTTSGCFGDSGGPLTVDDGGSPLLVGVVSWGPETCLEAGKPGVFTEIAAYADMVEAHLGAEPFTDVRYGHPFLTEIFHLEADGVLGGFEDGTYRPGNAVSRQAMSAFLYRLAGEPAFADPETPTFVDVTPTHPFFTEVEWMASEGISTGFEPGPSYRPGAPVSRQAMSAFIYRSQGEPLFAPPASPSFDDVSSSHPFFDEVEWMADTGITTGYADGTFKPGAAVTRQSMAAFLYRLQRLAS